MNKLINYLKITSIFLILELLITFITSFLNLLGLNSGITTIILFILNIIIFFVLNFINAHKWQKKGLIEGLILSFIFLILMFLIKIIFFSGKLHISTLIYYLILLFTGIFGSLVGVNKKSE